VFLKGEKKEMKRIGKIGIFTGVACLVILAGFMVWAAAGTEIDMTISDNEVTYNDAIFVQGPVDVNSSGTGVIDPFLTVDGGGNQAITRGYNTVDASAEFDTLTGGDRTRPVLLSGVPEVEIGGEFYREFKLDINKAKGGNPYLALDQLKLFLTANPAITGYDYAGGTEFGSNATKVWDLGDAVVLMDYALESGSGASDVSFYVRSTVFSTPEDCSYGSSECTTYVVMWNEFGDYADSALYPDYSWENNDGFEEWGLVLRPVVHAEKTAAGTYDQTHTWEVKKTVDPASQSAFAGDTVDFDWTITVTDTVTEGNPAASGVITITNPTGVEGGPIPTNVPAVIQSVDDVIDQGGLETTATVDCGVAFPYSLDGGETLVCSYAATPPDAEDGLNTATITLEVPSQIGGGTAAYEAYADLTFTANVINGSATLDDDWKYTDESVYNGWTDTYGGSYTCSSDVNDYTDGADLDNEVSNTAEVYSDDVLQDSSTATTAIDCYVPSIAKTAAGAYDERHEWEVLKTVDPASQSAFAGDTVTFDWTIVVTETVFEENFAVSGTITVDNPNPDDDLMVSLVDWVDGNAATIDMASCDFDGTDLTVAAGGSETCNYAASLSYSALADAPTVNTATITLNSIDFEATAGIAYTANVIDGSATLDDDRFPYTDQPVEDGWTSTYEDSYTCSSDLNDYTDGADLDNEVSNTAIVSAGGSEQDHSTATTTIDCYVPSIEKTAAGAYDERHDWEVLKTVDPASQSAFISETVTFDWTIVVSETVFDENFSVSGTITVDNPNPEDALVVSLVDRVDGNAATIDQTSCAFDGTDLTVAAGGSETCDYEANGLPYDALADAPTVNTATITLNSIDFEATADIDYAVNVINGSATLDDDRYPYSGEDVYDTWTSTYEDTYTCSSNLNDYTNGADLDNEVTNTAEVYSDSALQDSSTAITTIDCYAPSISKTAAGTYDERHEWDVVKTVDPTYQAGYPGDTLPWTWTISVTEDVYEENFVVSGTITVNNPNPDDELVVALSDLLSDGSPGVIDQGSCAFDGTDLTVAAGGSETCDYAASLSYDALADAPTGNTATITLNSIDFAATAGIAYTADVIRGSATLSDVEIGLTDVPVTGGDEETGDDGVTCSSERSAYGETGSYGDTITNTATLTDSDGNGYTDQATTEWLCEASFVDVYKTTNGAVDSSKEYRFRLYDAAGIDLNDEVTTLGDGDGLLQFQTALVPGAGYTICENPVPAGWQLDITLDGAPITTYSGPPGGIDPTGETQCFDFVAADSPTTLRFDINNSYPGGGPRTPGYWKNWSTCSGGNQVATATKLGGPDAGVYLLDDLLPQTIGEFTIDTCELGVSILDSRDVDSGKKRSSDAAYQLARNLLAAQLNLDAEACMPGGTYPYDGEDLTFTQVISASNDLLIDIVFDGTGGYLEAKGNKDKQEREDALYLAGILDDYNNSRLCTGTYSH
jgi:hypothetical protein